MTTTRFATIVDSAYLPRGIVMIDSLRQVAPGVAVDVLCMDAAARQGLEASGLPGVRALELAELESYDPELAGVRGGRSIAEYCWTAKSSLGRFLFDRDPHVDLIAYADADLMFFHSPQPLFDDLADWSALVVPQHAPPDERWERTHGRFNAGFVAFRRSPETAAILRSWRAQCLEWCYDRVEPGRFCDQKYLDEWPGVFPGVRVLANPRVVLAPWNASRHRLSARDGDIYVDDVLPLVFFHFQSLEVHRGLTNRLVALHLLPARFRSLSRHGSLSWSVWDSYRVSDDAVRHVYEPYVRRLDAAASRLAAQGFGAAASYGSLGAMQTLREIARAVIPAPLRRLLRRRRVAAEEMFVSGAVLGSDKPPIHRV